MPRFFCDVPLATGQVLDLPPGAARHVQVLRLQPGDPITLFNGAPGQPENQVEGEFEATVLHMGRTQVQVQVGPHHATRREARTAVHLAIGMPANDRMDWLVEKATELGVASIQPLMGERSVLRLSGPRAEKKIAHWQSVAIASCEQCGGNRVPQIHPVQNLGAWLAAHAPHPSLRLILSLQNGARPMASSGAAEVLFLSGPEGGWSPAEEQAALQAGFAPVSLGPRVLRAETAALVALAAWVV
jgi:16S rRNA (uracil1498-N3)-methyltransferase